jgi:hypothetical protein
MCGCLESGSEATSSWWLRRHGAQAAGYGSENEIGYGCSDMTLLDRGPNYQWNQILWHVLSSRPPRTSLWPMAGIPSSGRTFGWTDNA